MRAQYFPRSLFNHLSLRFANTHTLRPRFISRRGLLATATTRPRNFSTLAQSKEVNDQGVSESLEDHESVLSKIAYCFYQGAPGDKLGDEDRFELKRRIASTFCSPVWLARDHKLNQFVAVKILSCIFTEFNLAHLNRELDAYKALGSGAAENNCSTLIDHFLLHGFDESRADKRQLCLVYDLPHCKVHDIVERLIGEDKEFPLRVVKLIVKDVLTAASYMHKKGIAHLALYPVNVTVAADSTVDIKNWLDENPPKKYTKASSWHQKREFAYLRIPSPWETQELPLPAIENLEEKWFILSNFASCAFLNSRFNRPAVAPIELRTPEAFFSNCEWDLSIDIWNVGLLTYYLLALGDLFKTEAPPAFLELLQQEPQTIKLHVHEYPRTESFEEELPPESPEYVMYQMMLYCDPYQTSRMARVVLSASARDRCLGVSSAHTGVLEKIKDSLWAHTRDRTEARCDVHLPFKLLLKEFAATDMTEEECEGAARFIARCLRFEPSERATADELLRDPWLRDVCEQ
ncbi:hypothetical protein AX16_007731 [Volvariella volvacea WC 439]|nr:hypothetical protein AX16_007731 [Volvariella volvacea WC 439]